MLGFVDNRLPTTQLRSFAVIDKGKKTWQDEGGARAYLAKPDSAKPESAVHESAKPYFAKPETAKLETNSEEKIVLKIILKIILRCNFDFETCPNYQTFRNFLVYKISR